jgi:hypothetical protein
MTVTDLVAKLQKSQHRADAIARVVGYAAMIQKLGWDNLPVSRESLWRIEKMFRLLDLDPLKVEF